MKTSQKISLFLLAMLCAATLCAATSLLSVWLWVKIIKWAVAS